MFKSKRVFIILYIFAICVMLFLLGPILISMIGAFSKSWHKSLLFSGFTIKWFSYVLTYYGRTISLSLLLAFLTMFLTIIIGVPASYVLVKYNFKFSNLLEQIITLPMAIPGLAIAIALIQIFSVIRGYWFFILIGHFIITIAYMVNTVSSTLRSINFIELEESAASLGANGFTIFKDIIVPNIKNAIMAGALMVFTISLGEFNLTLFMYTPLTMTLPVGLYESYASLRLEIGSAYTTIFLIIIIPILTLIQNIGSQKNISAIDL